MKSETHVSRYAVKADCIILINNLTTSLRMLPVSIQTLYDICRCYHNLPTVSLSFKPRASSFRKSSVNWKPAGLYFAFLLPESLFHLWQPPAYWVVYRAESGWRLRPCTLRTSPGPLIVCIACGVVQHSMQVDLSNPRRARIWPASSHAVRLSGQNLPLNNPTSITALRARFSAMGGRARSDLASYWLKA